MSPDLAAEAPDVSGGAEHSTLQSVIETLSAQLDRAVAVDDPQLRLLAYTAHFEEVDEHRIHSILRQRASPQAISQLDRLNLRRATAPVRIPGDGTLGMLGRLCIPIRAYRHLLGFLWLLDNDETLSEEEIRISVLAAEIVGSILYRQRMSDDARRAAERNLLLRLLDSSPGPNADSRELSVADRTHLETWGLSGEMPCRLAVVDVRPSRSHRVSDSPGWLDVALRRHLHRLRSVRTLAATDGDDVGYVLVASSARVDPLGGLRTFGSAICEELGSNRPDRAIEVLVGIGPLAARVDDARLGPERPRHVIDVVRSVPGFSPVTAWEDLGIYAALHELMSQSRPDPAVPPGLRALWEHSSDLIETLDTYLDTAGNAKETARLLSIHRTTLYYRLAKVEEITGMCLSDGEHRLALHLGVKLGRLAAGDALPPPHRGRT